MAALVINNVPEDVLARLKERAKANHRSLTKEAIVLLSQGVAQVAAPSRERSPTEPPDTLPGGRSTIDEVEDAAQLSRNVPRTTPDGREALRAALVKQPDGSLINLLGIDDELFFETLAKIRSEFRPPEPPDFGEEQR
jgi:plasmid stability protein